MNFTPGPWVVGKKYLSDIYAGNSTVLIARAMTQNVGSTESESNAHLIAAAPEMYELLCKVRDLVDNREKASSFGTYELLRAALKKAEGL